MTLNKIEMNMAKMYHFNMTDIKKIFGQNLKKLRQEKKLTQEIFAESVGMATKTINAIENGRQFPKLENFEKICEVYKISPHELLIARNEISDYSKSKLIMQTVYQLENLSKKEVETINKLIAAYRS